jgi:hypothetical protein
LHEYASHRNHTRSLVYPVLATTLLLRQFYLAEIRLYILAPVDVEDDDDRWLWTVSKRSGRKWLR